ncbi:MAG: hypothetical protein A2817_02325 [Candidatus Yanofskybacteria bacterium RIFCSPHIGHO2_01_FULL_39_8b]|uniref:DoxX family protein n=1 Tax=Candidatus Yanofskybacteria bacterium RIFCSPHIGHO2_01_FULL_39_8b TaxID=1802659 RepID=A0A1F8ECY2_9BACT|nr:MAG: hypothetical protein A2817_02325 [Candidatus Yanofskybacteria bacterium RIFCSPHIGHO2_01_FULL_39_8b]
MYSGLFLLRLAVGVIFIYHAIPKLRDPQKMASGAGWTNLQVLGLGIIEFMGAVSLIGGVSTRFSALVLAIVMVGAMYHKIKKWHVPFMSAGSTGWEFDFLLFCANLTIYLKH